MLSPMRVAVLCFGRLRELLAPEIVIEVALPATVGDLWRALRERYPGKTLDGFMRLMWTRHGAPPGGAALSGERR